MIPSDLPPWAAVYQQVPRWINAGVFEEMVHDPREILLIAAGREANPTAVVIDSRTLQGTPQSGHRGVYDGAKRKRGSKVHSTVYTLGHLLALHVTPADEQGRSRVRRTAKAVQKAAGKSVGIAYIDQCDSGEQTEDDAEDHADDHGIMLQLVKPSEAKRDFVLLLRRWVVHLSIAWMTRFRRLARGFERLPRTVARLYFAVFACIMLARCYTTSG